MSPFARSILIGFFALAAGSACGFHHSKVSEAAPIVSPQFDNLDYAQVNAAIFQPKCAKCHDEEEEPRLSTYAEVIAELGNIEREVLINHTMPRRRPLEPGLQAMLRQWIDAGAPEIVVPAETPASEASPSPAAPTEGTP